MLRHGGWRELWMSTVVDVSGKFSLTGGRVIECHSPSGVGGV